MIFEIIYLIGSYFMGSIPFGLLLTKFSGFGDIRKIGSGNIGATNVLRSGNKTLAALTLILDATKAALPIILGKNIFDENIVYLASFLAICGHIFPIWLGFKGGKGVSAFAATLITITPYIGLSFCLMWLTIFKTTRISSLASILSSLSIPIIVLFTNFHWNLIILYSILSILIVAKHKSNIIRLLHGEEKSITLSREKNGQKVKN